MSFLSDLGIAETTIQQIGVRDRSGEDTAHVVGHPAPRLNNHDRVVVAWPWYRIGGSGHYTVHDPLGREASYHGSVVRVTRRGYHIAVDGRRATAIMRVTFRELKRAIARIEREATA